VGALAGGAVLLPIKGVELWIRWVEDSRNVELGLSRLVDEVAKWLEEGGSELLGRMLGALLDLCPVAEADLPPADALGQLLTVTVVVEAGHLAHSALARGQMSVLEAADVTAGEVKDPKTGGLFTPPAGGEARQELDTLVVTTVTAASRPSNSARSRAAISCAPMGTLPKNTQEAANKAKQLFAYI
jgi:hypothetical protein